MKHVLKLPTAGVGWLPADIFVSIDTDDCENFMSIENRDNRTLSKQEVAKIRNLLNSVL